MSNQTKVYCRDCNHINRPSVNLGLRDLGPNPIASCQHPSNCVTTRDPTWYSPNTTTKYTKEPSELNVNNDCPNWNGNRSIGASSLMDNTTGTGCVPLGNSGLGDKVLK